MAEPEEEPPGVTVEPPGVAVGQQVYGVRSTESSFGTAVGSSSSSSSARTAAPSLSSTSQPPNFKNLIDTLDNINLRMAQNFDNITRRLDSHPTRYEMNSKFNKLETLLQQPRQVMDLTNANRCRAVFVNNSSESIRLRSHNRWTPNATGSGGGGYGSRNENDAFAWYQLAPGEKTQVEAIDGQTKECTSFVVEMRNMKDWWWGRRGYLQFDIRNSQHYQIRDDWKQVGAKAVRSAL